MSVKEVMFVRRFQIEGSFEESARKAIIAAFEEKGRVPVKVSVYEVSNPEKLTEIRIEIADFEFSVPVDTRPEGHIGGLQNGYAQLDVSDPESPFE